MSRNKDKNDRENLLGIIRQLKSENKNLKKQVKHFNKNKRKTEDLELELQEVYIEEEFNEKTSANNCPNCKKNITKEVDLGVRKIITCDGCGWRKIIKGVGIKRKKKNGR